jgi:hypothetical protein
MDSDRLHNSLAAVDHPGTRSISGAKLRAAEQDKMIDKVMLATVIFGIALLIGAVVMFVVYLV